MKSKTYPAGLRSLDEGICEKIFDAILEQRLAPGTRLSEEKLGDIFKVSRTVVRQALLRLKMDGVVEIAPNRGASVANCGEIEARQVFEARRIAEDAVTRLACQRVDGAGLQRLRHLHALEKQAYTQGNRGRGLRLSGEFHLAIASLAGNDPLRDFIRRLVSKTSLIIARYERSGPPGCPYDEHADLISALAKAKVKKSCRLMRQHLDHIEGNMDFKGVPVGPSLETIFRQSA